MHNPTPSFAEEQILFSPLKQDTYKTIASSVDILHFLKQSCSYIIKFLRSEHLLKMSMWHC